MRTLRHYDLTSVKNEHLFRLCEDVTICAHSASFHLHAEEKEAGQIIESDSNGRKTLNPSIVLSSRPMASILDELRHLVDLGIKGNA